MDEFGEAFDEGREAFGHPGHEFVEHAALPEQRVDALPGRVAFRQPVYRTGRANTWPGRTTP